MTTNTKTLLDHYLAAIGLLLPSAEKADILAELRANLESEIDDRAEAKGSPLTEDEVCELIRAHGEPGEVAARFFPQNYLVGPAHWPYFWLGVKVLAVAAAVIAFINTVVKVSSVGHGWAWAVFPVQWPLNFLGLALPLFAVLVILVALAERGRIALGNTPWNPRDLGKDGVSSLFSVWANRVAKGACAVNASVEDRFRCRGHGSTQDPKPASRSGAARARCEDAKPHPVVKIFGDVFGAVVAVIGWFALFHYPHLITGGVPTNLLPAPVWEQSYTLVMGILAAKLVVAAIPLLQPSSRALRQAMKAVDAVLGLFSLQPFLAAPALVIAQPVSEGVRDLTFLAEQINRWQYPVLVFLVVVTAIQVLVHAGKSVAALVKSSD